MVFTVSVTVVEMGLAPVVCTYSTDGDNCSVADRRINKKNRPKYGDIDITHASLGRCALIQVTVKSSFRGWLHVGPVQYCINWKGEGLGQFAFMVKKAPEEIMVFMTDDPDHGHLEWNGEEMFGISRAISCCQVRY